MSEVVSSEAAGPSPRAERRPWWRRGVSLRALMVAVLIVGAGLGLLANRVATRARALAAIREAGGIVAFRDSDSTLTGPWIRLFRWTGVEFCREVVQLSFPNRTVRSGVEPWRDGDPVPRGLTAAMGRIGEVHVVALSHCTVAASDLAPLAGTAVEHLRLGQLAGLIDDQPGSSPLLPRLQMLSLGAVDGGELPRSALGLAGRMPRLEKLYLESPLAPLAGPDLAPLARLRDLNLLDLNRTVIDESALAPLDEMPQLRAIWIRRARMSDATLGRIVARHPDLVSIEVDGSALTDAGVASLTRAPGLVMAILRGTPEAPGHLTDASLIALGRVKTLRRLVVTCGRFGAAGLDGLQGLKFLRLALRSIEPGSTPALIRLVGGQQFEWLRLGGPGVTDDLLPHLAPTLVPKRAVLELTDSAITDAGLTHLAPLSVFELVLIRTAIDDAGLAGLPGRFGPRRLYLRGTRATAAGIGAFDLAHPGVVQSSDEILDDD